MDPTRFDPRLISARLAPPVPLAAWALALALSGPAGAAPLRLSLDIVGTPGPTGEAAEPAAVPKVAAEAEAGEEFAFAAAPDLPLRDLVIAPGTATPDDDWLQSARVQQDEAASGTDRQLGDFAPAVLAALTISADPIDEVKLPAARPEPDAATTPMQRPQAEPSALPPLAWAAVPVLGLLLVMAAAAWRSGRSGRSIGPRSARAAA